jgi:hypothetical protein
VVACQAAAGNLSPKRTTAVAFKFKLPKVDIFPGREDDLLLIVIGAIALGYVATGVNAWAEDKWTRAAGGTTGALAFLKTGKLAGKRKGHQEGWDQGFNTLNPALHLDELVSFDGGRGGQQFDSGFRGGRPDAPNMAQRMAGAVAGRVVQGVAQGVAEQAVGVGVDYAMGRFSNQQAVPPPVVIPPPDMPLSRPLGEVLGDQQQTRAKKLQGKTVAQLKRIAREHGMGGSWLSSARKADVIARLLKG